MTTPQYISSSGQLTPPFGAHDTLNAYNPGDMVYANGNVYIANAAIAAGTPFTVGASHFKVAVMGAESTSSISNGNSNVSIPTSGGNVTISSNGLSNVVVISSNNGANTSLINASANITALNIDGGNLVKANYFTGNIINGNSNIKVAANANITFSANGTANVLKITEANVTVTGNAIVSGNISISATGKGVIFQASDANATTLTDYNISVVAPNSNAVTANYTLTLPPTAGSNLQFLQTDGSGTTKWSDASIKVTIANSSTTKPSNPLSGDQLIVTTTGYANGVTNEEWTYSGSANSWIQVQGTPPVGSSIIDNTITDSYNIAYIGTYIVPASGLANAFVGHANAYAAFDGSGFTFTTPTANDTVLITSGTNAGQNWKYANATAGWSITTGGTLSAFNWVLTQKYPASALVVYAGAIYQANDNIPANTPWATGTTGATWKALSAGGAYQVETFTATAAQTIFNVSITPVGAVAMYVNGILISANAATVSGKQVTYVAANNGAYALRAGDKVTITYMYGAVSTNLVNAEYGEAILTQADYATTPNAYVDLTGGTFTLPSAGTWEVTYHIRSITAIASGYFPTQIIRGDGSAVFGSTTLSGYASGVANFQAVGSQTVRITTTGAETCKLQGRAYGQTITVTSDSKVSWKKISGFTPIAGLSSTTTEFGNINASGTVTTTGSGKILATPNWTDAGTVSTVGLTAYTAASTIGTAPTVTTSTNNSVLYRQVGPKTWQVRVVLNATTGTSGSGDYVFTLPNSLQFDTTVPGQGTYQGGIGASSYATASYAIPGYSGYIYNASTTSTVQVIPWSSTQYRIVGSLYNTGVQCMGSGSYPIPTSGTIRLTCQFEFQTP